MRRGRAVRRMGAAVAVVMVLFAGPAAYAATTPSSGSTSPSGNVQFQVTIPPTHSTTPTTTPSASGASGSRGPASTGTPVLQLLAFGGGIALLGAMVLLGSRLVGGPRGRRT